jgi:DNA-directed RNA polymerase subunit K/omega
MPPKNLKSVKPVKEPVKSIKEEEEKVEKVDVSYMASDAYDFYKNYDTSKNKMDPILNQYERASVIGIRAQQISEGAIPMIDVPEGIENPIEIATMELKMKKMPLIICREGREYWRVCDLVDLENE